MTKGIRPVGLVVTIRLLWAAGKRIQVGAVFFIVLMGSAAGEVAAWAEGR